jgi:cytidyltransferase-like protein
MNLGQYIAQQLLEADEAKPTIALFPGAFKPPHKGHFDVVKKLLEKADQVVVLISPKNREGITAEESVAVWNLYKPLLDGTVEVKITEGSPIQEAFNTVKNNPDTNFIAAFGKGEFERFRSMDKFSNVEVFDAGAVEGINATGLRNSLNNNNKELENYLPDGISESDFLAAIGKKTPLSPEIPKAEDAKFDNDTIASLKESHPETLTSPYQDLVLNAMSKIEKTAQDFNLPKQDIQYAFETGNEVVLSDSTWKELQNTKSYSMKTLDDAIQHALKLGINPKPYIDYIKQGKDIPLPLMLTYGVGKNWLVGGEIILSLYRALGSIPTVLQGNVNLAPFGRITAPVNETLNEGKLTEKQNDTIYTFLKFATKELGLKKLPKLTISHDTKKSKAHHTFGYFDPNNNSIWIYFGDRVMADVLRTLAHELVHRKQEEEGRIKPDSGKTGSTIENEANAKAGVLLRKFGKNHPEIY